MAKAPTVAPLRIESLRLDPGSHASPREGVCIVELASILAKEKFSDEPDCVCPVIGAYLRSWNDRAGGNGSVCRAARLVSEVRRRHYCSTSTSSAVETRRPV